MKEVKSAMETEERITELEGIVETITKERDEAKSGLEEAGKKQRIAEARVVIDDGIGKAELPEAAKSRLLKGFTGRESAEGLTEAIKEEADYVASLTEKGKVKGMGGKTEVTTEDSHKALVEAFKRAGLDDKGAEIAASGR